MVRRSVALILAALLWASAASAVLGADVVGTALDPEGNRVKGIEIAALSPTGKVAGKAITNSAGDYRITNLEPATHDFALDPAGTPFQPGTAVAFVGKEGMTINWRLSRTAEASAIGAPGIAGGLPGGHASVVPDAFGLIVDGVGAAGAVSGFAAGGGFGSGPRYISPPSPSM